MSERRFILTDFTYMDREGVLRLYEACRTYRLSQAIAHAATKRELIAKQRPPVRRSQKAFADFNELGAATAMGLSLAAKRRYALSLCRSAFPPHTTNNQIHP
jgi:hypothetical protein